MTGLDLVRQQILVAVGEPLAFSQSDLSIDGHAIEARLYAEDATAGFLPATGTLSAFHLPARPSARLDSGVETGSVVGVDFDPMLAKVIVHGPTRREAALRLALVLEGMTISGVVTNRDFLVATLRSEAFLVADTTTDFIERVDPGGSGEPPAVELARLMAATVLYRQALNRDASGALSFMRSGYRNSVMPPEQMILTRGEVETVVAYRSRRDGSFEVTVGEDSGAMAAAIVHRSPGVIEAVIDGVRSRFDLVRAGDDWHVQGSGFRADFVERSRFPETGPGSVAGGQLAPMPGTVRVVAVSVGDQVTAGQTLVVMEAMKMEHNVAAPDDAVVSEVRCAVGDQVDNGQVLVVLRPFESTEEAVR